MTAEFSQFISKNIDDPAYLKELIRPAEIKEDVKLLQQRKRVSNIMRSKLFKKNLESLFKLNNLHDNADGKSTSTLFLADINEQLLLSALPKKKIESLYQLSQRKGIICINDLYEDDSSPYDQKERISRCKLVSVFRLVDMYGWNNDFNAVLTMRPFNDREQFLINPFGLLFHEITASSLISMDFTGNILDFGSTVLDIHPLNWFIHSAIYSVYSDINVILHLKTSASIFVSSISNGLLPLSTEAIILGKVQFLNNLYDIERCDNDHSKYQHVLAEYINYMKTSCTQSCKLFIMPNNGIFVCGYTVEEAWYLLTNCQEACEIQLKMNSFEVDDYIIPSEQVQDNILNKWHFNNLGNSIGWRIGQMEFEGLMRYLDNNGYRSGYFYNQENIYRDNGTVESTNNKYQCDVEIAAFNVCDNNAREDEETLNKTVVKTKSDKWFNTPNKYKLLEDGTENYLDVIQYQLDKKSSRWISSNTTNLHSSNPQRPITAGAYVSFGSDKSCNSKEKISLGVNPKEFKETQKRVKNKYYNDINTAGPMSCLMDSAMNSDDKKRLKSVAMENQIGSGCLNADVITSASKGVVQRGQKAIIFQDLYKPSNPFDNITADDLNKYKLEIDRKLNPNRYTEDSTDIDVIQHKDDKIVIPNSQSVSSVLKQSLHEAFIEDDKEDQIVDPEKPIVVESKQMFQASDKPVCGTMTSETSGADFSHDELDRQNKVKKKRRFKLPSFVKKKKDKNN